MVQKCAYGDGIQPKHLSSSRQHQQWPNTIHLLKHSGNSGRTKHIAVRYNMIREAIKEHKIQVVYTLSEAMVADIFTIPLGMRLFPIQQCAVSIYTLKMLYPLHLLY